MDEVNKAMGVNPTNSAVDGRALAGLKPQEQVEIRANYNPPS